MNKYILFVVIGVVVYYFYIKSKQASGSASIVPPGATPLPSPNNASSTISSPLGGGGGDAFFLPTAPLLGAEPTTPSLNIVTQPNMKVGNTLTRYDDVYTLGRRIRFSL